MLVKINLKTEPPGFIGEFAPVEHVYRHLLNHPWVESAEILPNSATAQDAIDLLNSTSYPDPSPGHPKVWAQFLERNLCN